MKREGSRGAAAATVAAQQLQPSSIPDAAAGYCQWACRALSGAVLVAIWCRFHSAEFCWAVPRVCRRWRRLCWDPRLLERISIDWWTTERNDHSLLAFLRSLCGWMAGAAGHVRALMLEVDLPLELPAAEQHKAAALLANIVTACGRGGLRSLHLFNSPAASGALSSWLGMATDLRRLELAGCLREEQSRRSDLAALLRGLSQLEHLALSDMAFEVPEGPVPALPASLTSLGLSSMSDYVPKQVRVGLKQACGSERFLQPARDSALHPNSTGYQCSAPACLPHLLSF